MDEIVLSLYAKHLTTRISAHFAEIYGASVSKETISRITDKALEEVTDWANRPLNGVYATVFIDAIVVKVRDGQVGNRPIYAPIGASLAGEKDVLGLWAGTGGEGAKFWLSVLADLKNRGVNDVFFLVCDSLKGLPDVLTNVWPLTTVQSLIYAPWCWRDGPVGHPRRLGQELCRHVAFEVQMQTCPAGAVAGRAFASGSSA